MSSGTSDCESNNSDQNKPSARLTRAQSKLLNSDTMGTFNPKDALRVIPEFNGDSSNLHRFIACCEIVYEGLKETEQIKFIKFLKVKLTGKAYDVVKYKDFTSWKSLKVELEAQFKNIRSMETLHFELVTISQQVTEDVRTYANRLQLLLSELNDACIESQGSESASLIKSMNSKMALKSFQEGLKAPIKLIIKACRFTDIPSAIAKACEEELITLQKSTPIKNTIQPKLDIIKCQLCNKQGHLARKCYSLTRVSGLQNSAHNPTRNYRNTSSVNLICAYCKIYGHHINNCFKKQRVDGRSQNTNNNNTSHSKSQAQENFMGLELQSSNKPVRAQDLNK